MSFVRNTECLSFEVCGSLPVGSVHRRAAAMECKRMVDFSVTRAHHSRCVSARGVLDRRAARLTRSGNAADERRSPMRRLRKVGICEPRFTRSEYSKMFQMQHEWLLTAACSLVMVRVCSRAKLCKSALPRLRNRTEYTNREGVRSCNAMEWNGMEWNGMEWNGMEWNGLRRSEPRAAPM